MSTETTKHILEAGSEIFRDFGFRKTSLNDIAELAGVSRQTIYVHFKDKETLFQACFEFEMSRNLREIESILSAGGNPQSMLLNVFKVWHGAYVHRARHLHSEAESPAPRLSGGAFEKHREAFLSRLADCIETTPALRQGLGPNLSATEITIALTATSLGLVSFCRSEDDYAAKLTTTIVAIFSLNQPPNGESK